MSKAPKYSFRVVEKRNKTWTAEIQRQATSKKKVVSKRQTNFATEAEGITWAEEQLKEILAKLVAKNKRHDEERAEQYQDKLKKAALLASEAALEASEQELNKSESEESFSLTEAEQEKAIADLEELEALESNDADDELKNKPDTLKFDFEIELEEAEQAEKEAAALAKKKAKAAKKAKAEEVVEDDVPTADGSEEVNSIYLNK
ncbi:DUF3622 domain-containing protein [Thalassomonas sp. M1454]|uniref:DUF3622 domain-containing protein n=1 Tax=Thalassomonas sp. M1454 TaxID=2594477 RepID=UPI00117F7C77|nr:DUF3622 domain-containing protein [Thalassomonas sp. M1454]TRX54459.1 DUF3622 domain-containing protein [Thalassomonas sp. M1454]